jgi:hypothetical protein
VRRRVAVAAALFVGACAGGDVPAEDLLLRVRAGTDDVALGRAFPLTVLRVWSRDLTPEPWSDAVLAPLTLRLRETQRIEDGRRVAETLRFDAYAFQAGKVTVAPPTFTARTASDAVRVARGDAVVVESRATLDARAPGPPELPGDPVAVPLRLGRWSIAVAGALALAAVAVLRRRRRGAVASVETMPPRAPESSPDAVALAGLERLRDAGAEDAVAWHVGAAQVLRGYLAARFGVPTRERTTEEIVASLRPAEHVGPEERHLVADVLRRCDGVKFAGELASATAREGLLRDAEDFVRRTRDRA